MAATGYTPIQLYYSTTAAAVPTAGNLASGELAINITDGKLYYKSNAGVVTLLAGATAGPAGGSNTQVQFNSSGALAGSANMTFNGTTLTVNDLTDSSLTAGRVVYATTGGNLTSSANLLYSGTDLTVYGLIVGRGAGAVATNTAVGKDALSLNTTGDASVAVGYEALQSNTTGEQQVAVGFRSLKSNTTGTLNIAMGRDALSANTTGGNNTAIGTLSLASNTTASNNTAVGYQSLYTSNGTGGQGQVAIGYQAGYSNTTGFVTAVGNQASFAQTTGSGNSAFGNQAMRSTTTGSNNVAIGETALYSNTTASNNTAVGLQAAYTNATGTRITAVGYIAAKGGVGSAPSYSVAVGSFALTSVTSADSNTAVGDNSMAQTTTGSGNTAVGQSSLSANTTGASNTALGLSALQSNTTASNNTAVGFQAGYSNTTGANLVALGYQAGYSSNADNNTFIGYYAGQGTTGTRNTFVGVNGAGYLVTSGTKNTILGGFSGNQGGLDIRTASNYIVLSDGDGTIGLSTGFNSSVALNGAVPQSGTGITFPAAQNASPNANTLDDYEEGTWTPRLIDVSGGSATGYSVRTGVYTKVGNVVVLKFQIVLTNKGSLSSALRITDLPFSTSQNGFQGTGLATADFTGLTSNLTFGMYASDLYMYNQGATAQINVSGSYLTNTSAFDASITYQVL